MAGTIVQLYKQTLVHCYVGTSQAPASIGTQATNLLYRQSALQVYCTVELQAIYSTGNTGNLHYRHTGILYCGAPALQAATLLWSYRQPRCCGAPAAVELLLLWSSCCCGAPAAVELPHYRQPQARSRKNNPVSN
jgi:hypothetical protein